MSHHSDLNEVVTDPKSALPKGQYTPSHILQYEHLMGANFMSCGGLNTTKMYAAPLEKHGNAIKEGTRILDVGCGIGGSAFYFALLGATVLGVDLSTTSIAIAKERLKEQPEEVQKRCTFQLGDALQLTYEDASFDLVYSRDAILHIPYAQKTELFKLAVKWLKPTGHLLLTDYGTRPDPSDKLKEYAKKRGYYLSTPEGYAEIVEDAGFAVVEGPDRTWDYVTSSHAELRHLEATKDEFVGLYGEEAYKSIGKVYRDKIDMCLDNDRSFVMILASPLSHMKTRVEVLASCQDVFNSGLVMGTDGNVSSRIPGHNLMAVKASGVDYPSMTLRDVVVCEMDGTPLAGEKKPSSEINLHIGLYKHRPDFKAIVHTHSTYASAVSCTRKDMPCFHYSMGEVTTLMSFPCAKYACYGTPALASHVISAVGTASQGCLMSNHGQVCGGADLDAAVYAARRLENLCEVYVKSRGLEVINMSKEEMEECMERDKT